ncbi:hypothetical protein KDW_06500 [Dictyobacter vulcani]|uniref:Uncharacterized protein n=1 Tax=Dictyobacter vulcani TaxID=2607529 RepID=A0A5J4KCJ7_9CHLR|nr:hypothetical protein KDW_06500 [Dictyobacter vulcani]
MTSGVGVGVGGGVGVDSGVGVGVGSGVGVGVGSGVGVGVGPRPIDESALLVPVPGENKDEENAHVPIKMAIIRIIKEILKIRCIMHHPYK